MKRSLLIIAIVMISIKTNCQLPDTIFKDKKVAGDSFRREQFYVLASDKKTKYGTYVKYMVGNKRYFILETGRYINDRKEGTWTSFFFISIKDQINSRSLPRQSKKRLLGIFLL
jgi:hypothetical protein